MSLTQSRMVRRLVSDTTEALKALKGINFPRMPVEVKDYPLANEPWGFQKFSKLVSSEEEFLQAVGEAILISPIRKALVIGWPDYSHVYKVRAPTR